MLVQRFLSWTWGGAGEGSWGWRMCSRALEEIPIPREGLVEQQRHHDVDVVACQQAHGPKSLLLCAGLQLGFELFQDALHNLFNLHSRARRTSVVPSLLPSLLFPVYQLLKLKVAILSVTLLKAEFWGTRGQRSRGPKKIPEAHARNHCSQCLSTALESRQELQVSQETQDAPEGRQNLW